MDQIPITNSTIQSQPVWILMLIRAWPENWDQIGLWKYYVSKYLSAANRAHRGANILSAIFPLFPLKIDYWPPPNEGKCMNIKLKLISTSTDAKQDFIAWIRSTPFKQLSWKINFDRTLVKSCRSPKKYRGLWRKF